MFQEQNNAVFSPAQGEVHKRSTIKITGRLIAAARGLAGVSREEFAGAAGIPVEWIALMEVSGSAWLNSESDAEAVIRAFERFGVVVIDEDASMGAGVRLKFTRQDVKQISRLESEGGIVRSDDAP
ncbi:XRE family transcriptional regulator [Bradyrhizobium sp. CB1717]|uniref:XRE family transcriptional regulator n=1 Tax=Bradyrhizobium sp. CB1717 TaxID=3039154 RepID=UPI0024B27654|nr:XRE family transcriptional regulator [Bradyrhizobium sp. CB1717]WFU23687.1 XRE family transcriptional regulator [Bradyrhizobium sp. CB1717]